MLKVLQREEWVAAVEKTRPLLLNEQYDVVQILCSADKLTPVYFLYQKKNRIVITYIALTRNKTIKHPFHFFYTAFWIDPTLSDTQYCQYLDEFLKALMVNYRNIVIKLPVGLTDIRPFLWTNFSVVNYYTYVKNLADLSYHSVTEKNIRKAKNESYECRHEELSEDSLLLNMQIFKELRTYSPAKIKVISDLILVMKRVSYVTSFNCYKDEKLVAANLVFLDPVNKMAYTVLLNKVPRTIRDDVHSLLHDFFFTKLRDDGYEYVDLLGGDMQGIAPFKSRFKTELKPHFLVTYSENRMLLLKGVRLAKSIIQKVLAKII